MTQPSPPAIPNVSFQKKQGDRLEFEILSIENLRKKREVLDHSPTLPHRLSFYIILVITKGSGTHFIDFKPYPYSENSILTISRGQVHAFDKSMQNKGFLILFTDSFLSKNMIHSDILSLSRLYNYHLTPPVITGAQTKGQGFKIVMKNLQKEYDRPNDFAKEEMLRLLLKMLLLKMERLKSALIPQKTNPAYIEKLTLFKTRLDTHFARTRNASDYADMMSVSYKHLNTIRKEISGFTAKQFIDNHVILEAKRYLATTDISIKELTYDMGFDEPTNFVKFFSKHTQMTPAVFKKFLKK